MINSFLFVRKSLNRAEHLKIDYSKDKKMCNQVSDCPLSETSSGGEDEDVCEASAAGAGENVEY